MKEAIGFTDTRFLISGAAPIYTDILHLFQSLDIPLFEGYGMTENAAAATANHGNANKIGTVGQAIPETEIKTLDNILGNQSKEKAPDAQIGGQTFRLRTTWGSVV